MESRSKEFLQKIGAWAFIIGPVEFVAAMGIEEALRPGYNPFSDVISDLGVGPYNGIFNSSIIVLGILTFVAALLTWAAFPRYLSAHTGALLLCFTAIGAIGVGLYNETTKLHGRFAAIAFIGSGLALIFYARALSRDPQWRSWALPTAIGGVFTFVSIILFVVGAGGSPLHGFTERLIVVPVLLWAPFVGYRLLHNLKSSTTAKESTPEVQTSSG